MKNAIFGITPMLSVGLVAALITITSSTIAVADDNQTPSTTQANTSSELSESTTDSEALAAEVTQLHKETILAIEAYDGMLWSTTVKVKGIKREPFLDKAEKAMAAGDYAAAKTYLEIVNKQIVLAKEQADYQANGGWEKEAAYLLGTK